MRRTTRRAAITLAVTALGAGAVLAAPTAAADNKRLNESIVANVHTVMMRAAAPTITTSSRWCG